MKVLTVVGARPQFIKAAVLSPELAKRSVVECLVHTGQHYDFEMSDIFFQQLGLKQPDHFLGVGSASHAVQTGEMMKRLEPLMESEKPAWVLVYGDTNSTLAGALTAAKLRIPVAHVEAGLRSFNRDMPEEINRVVTDHVSDLLFAPTENAAKNLRAESLHKGIHIVGDLMIDMLLQAASRVEADPAILRRFGVEPRGYALVTVHRAANTESRAFHSIMSGLEHLPLPVIFPVHPRTRSLTQRYEGACKVIFSEPLPYLELVALQKHARVIITDSGGIQKEAYALGIPCVTLRQETEWVETLSGGWNLLVGTDSQKIAAAGILPFPASGRTEIFKTGHTAETIAGLLLRTRRVAPCGSAPEVLTEAVSP